jgi:hypothetical protein
LFLGLDAFFLELLNFTSKDGGRINSRVNAGSLDRDDNVAIVLQEVVSIESDDTSLIRLSNISENNIDHRDKHAVLVGVTSIFNDWDNVCSLLGHIDQITSRSVRELNGIDSTFGTNNVGNVRDGSTGGSTEIEDLLSRSNVDVINTTENTSGDLGTERIPDTVFNFGAISTFNGDALFAIDSFTGNQVLGDKQIFLAASNEDTFMSVGFNDDLGSSPSTTSGTSTTSTRSTTSTTGSTTAAAATTSTSYKKSSQNEIG